jgi:2-polyprenyl-3-methyl-5-hydroxy-6-metoxy-1,4-benzoquinol methylase
MRATTQPVSQCRLCGAEAPLKFTAPLSRELVGRYFECTRCHFLRSDHLDSSEHLRRVYDTARPEDDPGAAYRQLCIAIRLTEFVRARLLGFGPGVRMLDFGSATGFLPGALVSRFGWSTMGFDAYARPVYDPARVTKSWQEVTKSAPFDLVVATEVLEHFTSPVQELERIASVLRPDRSFVYVTTSLYDPAACSSDWDYLAPHTAQHCSFYSKEALATVAAVLDAKLVPVSGLYPNEWLFVRGGAALQMHARAAGWIIRALMHRRSIPGFPPIE